MGIFQQFRANSVLSAGPIAFFGTDMFARHGLSANPRVDGSSLGQLGDFLKETGEHQTGCSCGECAAASAKQNGDDVVLAPNYAIDVVPGDTSSLVTLTLGTYTAGEIDTLGDHDWYRVTLVAGQTYTFSIDPSGPGGAATDFEDSFLRLRSAAGALLASDDDGGLNTHSNLTFTATSSGTFFVDVGTYNDTETGTFRVLAVNAGTSGADTVAAFSGTTGTIAIGGQVNSAINTVGDQDWYAVTLTAGQRYQFRTIATGGGSDVDTALFIRDASGAKLGSNDDSGGGTYSNLIFTPSTTGTYYINVAAFANATSGAYTLTADLAPPLQVYTNDQIADQLINGYWGGPANARHFNVAPGGTITFNVQALTAAGQLLAREAFNLWGDATGIIFSEITTAAQITLDDNQSGAFASSTRSGNLIISSIVNVATSWLTTYGTGLNTYSFQTYIHEIGHAIGLGHAGNYNGNADYATDASYLNDAWATTVMSYFDQTENSYFNGLGFTRQFVVTPMVGDVLATTTIYGAGNTTRTGDTTYGFNNNSGRAVYDAATYASVTYTVVDHGGIDTLDYSGFSQNQLINLNEEAFSNIGARIGNVSIARGTVIENAIGGTGNDTLIGNAANNTLNGGTGTDTMVGGIGDDTYHVDNAGDVVTELSGEGTDTVVTALGAAAPPYNALYYQPGNVENLTGTNGSGQGVWLNSLNNVVTMGGGNDLIVMSEQAAPFTSAGQGSDTVGAGGGNDYIFFGGGFDASDTVDGGAGYDSVGLLGNYTLTLGASSLTGVELFAMYSSGSAGSPYNYTLTTHNGNVAAGQLLIVTAASLLSTEQLTFNGSAESDGRLQVFGGHGSDTITTGAGNDRIIGGEGADILTGGAGNDVFQYNNALESTAANRDTILDFTSGDRIDLFYTDANANAGGSQHFSFIGSGAFTNSAGQLRAAEQSPGQWLIEGDTNGDGVADLSILVTVTGGHTITAGDFFL